MSYSLLYPYPPLCRLEGEEQQDLTDSAVSIDPEYNILWSYSADTNKISCFNPIAANIEGMMYITLYTCTKPISASL